MSKTVRLLLTENVSEQTLSIKTTEEDAKVIVKFVYKIVSRHVNNAEIDIDKIIAHNILDSEAVRREYDGENVLNDPAFIVG